MISFWRPAGQRQCGFVELAFAELGREIFWEGSGLDEVGKDAKTGDVLVEIDPRYFRPAEVHHLIGDASKAKRELGWEAKIGLEELVQEMVSFAIPGPNRTAKRSKVSKKGFETVMGSKILVDDTSPFGTYEGGDRFRKQISRIRLLPRNWLGRD